MLKKPILFNTEMVRGILDGRKTVTRRVVKNLPTQEPYAAEDEGELWVMDEDGDWYRAETFAPYKPGDTIWVRETWKQYTTGTAGPGLIDGYLYKADEPQDISGMMVEDRWHPSIHMPRKAARLFLKVKSVLCERLNDMTEEDAISEGFPDSPAGTDSPLERFAELWDKTIKRADRDRYGWYGNPWVWVIEFERSERS